MKYIYICGHVYFMIFYDFIDYFQGIFIWFI